MLTIRDVKCPHTLVCSRGAQTHSASAHGHLSSDSRSLLQKIPIKETIFCKSFLSSDCNWAIAFNVRCSASSVPLSVPNIKKYRLQVMSIATLSVAALSVAALSMVSHEVSQTWYNVYPHCLSPHCLLPHRLFYPMKCPRHSASPYPRAQQTM